MGLSNGGDTSPGDLDFFEDYEDAGGIFEDRKNPPGSYQDPDAIEDLRNESAAVPMSGVVMHDNIAAPAPQFDGMRVLQSAAGVSMENFVCLAGPCDHYTEVIESREGRTVAIRRCDRVCTWAEQLRLDDVDMLGCSRHEVSSAVHPIVQERVDRGFSAVRLANERAAASTGISLGVCHEASCQHYAVMVLGDGESLTPQVERWCLRLGGAARPFKLDPNVPVIACSAVLPGAPRDALSRNKYNLESERAIRAARRTPRYEEGGSGSNE